MSGPHFNARGNKPAITHSSCSIGSALFDGNLEAIVRFQNEKCKTTPILVKLLFLTQATICSYFYQKINILNLNPFCLPADTKIIMSQTLYCIKGLLDLGTPSQVLFLLKNCLH